MPDLLLLGGWEREREGKKMEIITGVRSVTGFGGRAKYQSYCGGTVWYMRWTYDGPVFVLFRFLPSNTEIHFILTDLTDLTQLIDIIDLTDFTNISKCKEVDLKYPALRDQRGAKFQYVTHTTPEGTNQVLYRYKFLDTKQKNQKILHNHILFVIRIIARCRTDMMEGIVSVRTRWRGISPNDLIEKKMVRH